MPSAHGQESFDTASERTPAQQLMELELSIAQVERCTRVEEPDTALAGHA